MSEMVKPASGTAPLRVGDFFTLTRSISDVEVREFARLTGDFAANHIDGEAMRSSAFGQRMVHGALLVGLMSAASTELLARTPAVRDLGTCVSAGFDRVRFLDPVGIGESLTVTYQIEEIDDACSRAIAKATIINAVDGTIKAVGHNTLRWIDRETRERPNGAGFAGGRSTADSHTSALQVLRQLLTRRRSVRAYLPKAVAPEIIEEMLRTAQRVPSGCNTQPWRVAIVSGDRLDAFREGLLKCAATGQGEADIGWPREYRGVHKERRRDAAWALYENVGVRKGDRVASAEQTMLNYRFFDAPHVAIISTDEAIGAYGVLDCGVYLCALLLAAEALNISAVPQGAPAEFSSFIRHFLGLSDDRQVVCAVAFGYADLRHPANRTRTARAGMDEVVTWHGT
jgi:nitroreductase/acyl dehydratase